MKAFNVMTTNLVAAREGTTAREISTRLLIGNFNGLPVIDSGIKVIGIVTAVDILRASLGSHSVEGAVQQLLRKDGYRSTGTP